jgi:ElaB/YqjD/DUF883 family membrane-anchored ribosome-binding protein
MSERERELDEDQARVMQLIREHPWASVLGAAAVGFVVARLLRGEES